MSQPLQCADTSGFLFSHPCDRLATGQCATCGKPICIEHTRLTATGPRCVTCLREEQIERDTDPDRDVGGASRPPRTEAAAGDEPPASAGRFGGAGASSGWSAAQAAAAGIDPHFYGGSAAWADRYGAEDHAAFEPAASPDDPDTDGGSLENDPGGS